jgi:hypothetical protein
MASIQARLYPSLWAGIVPALSAVAAIAFVLAILVMF